ncbi:hypothetical protein RUM43_002676 [Polyplax serrata]|uniref:Uncharacterized protein n=1 Tax=Polyplax serrata TaxID=468196 RepID=A0AAN8NV42_POLSC
MLYIGKVGLCLALTCILHRYPPVRETEKRELTNLVSNSIISTRKRKGKGFRPTGEDARPEKKKSKSKGKISVDFPTFCTFPDRRTFPFCREEFQVPNTSGKVVCQLGNN